MSMEPAHAARHDEVVEEPRHPEHEHRLHRVRIRVKMKMLADAPTKPVTAMMRRAMETLPMPPGQARDQQRRDQATDAAEQQRQAGEQRAHLELAPRASRR